MGHFVNRTKQNIERYRTEIYSRDNKDKSLNFAGTMIDATAWVAMKIAFFERHPEYALDGFDFHLYILNQFARIPAVQVSNENMGLYRKASKKVKSRFTYLMQRYPQALKVFCSEVEAGIYDQYDSE